MEIPRLARRSDAEAIAELVNNAYRPAGHRAGWTHESALIMGDRTSAALVAEILSRPDSVILLVRRGAAIAACVHAEKQHDACYLAMLAVHPVLQGTGIGGGLLAMAEQHAAAAWSSTRFRMAVLSARTELLAFYQRRGYRRTGIVTGYPRDAGSGTPKQPGLEIETLEKESPLSCVLIIHEVASYPAWKAVFDGAAALRKEAGEISYQLLRREDSAEHIVHFSRWSSLDAARRFFESTALVEIRRRAGVKAPEFLYLNELESAAL